MQQANQPDRSMKKYHWSPKRFLRNFIILFSLIALSTFLLSTAVKATFTKEPASVAVITVLKGDTLWSIIHRLAPDADPRRIIFKIKQQNRLNSSDLVAGQQLEYALE